MDKERPPQAPPNFTVNWESITADAKRLIKEARESINDLVRNVEPSSSPVTFESVFVPLAGIESKIALQSQVLAFYRQVSTDARVRDASAEAENLFDAFDVELYSTDGLFALIKAVRELGEDLDEESSLYLRRTYEKAVRTGVNIQDEDMKYRFRLNQARLGVVKGLFLDNMAQNEETVDFTEAELEGVPDDVLSQLDKQEGKFRVPLSGQMPQTVLGAAKRGEVRRRLYIARENTCASNAPLLKEAIKLRYDAAHMLGFESDAALQLGARMAKTPEAVNNFLADLQSKVTPGALAALQVLKDLKQADLKSRRLWTDTPLDTGFFLWDYEFYHRMLLQQNLAVDGMKLREHLPLQPVFKGMLDKFTDLFGLKFFEVDGVEVRWHEDVQLFAVYRENAEGRLDAFKGYIYMDFFSRPCKRASLACFHLQPGFIKDDGTRHCPVAAVLCDFPKPSDGGPCLLRHHDAKMMFHELGHAIHDVASETRYASLHGPMATPVDYGEIPSQMLEEWLWTPSGLEALSCHYSHLDPQAWKAESDSHALPAKRMPDSLIDSIIKSRHYTFGPLFVLQQVQWASFDMAVHQLSTAQGVESVDLASLWNKFGRQIRFIDGPEALGANDAWGHGFTTFSHIMTCDYNAGFYGYLYSQVYAADIFYNGFGGDLANKEAASKYLNNMLAKGGARDGLQCIESFLGRKLSSQAFVENVLGLQVVDSADR